MDRTVVAGVRLLAILTRFWCSFDRRLVACFLGAPGLLCPRETQLQPAHLLGFPKAGRSTSGRQAVSVCADEGLGCAGREPKFATTDVSAATPAALRSCPRSTRECFRDTRLNKSVRCCRLVSVLLGWLTLLFSFISRAMFSVDLSSISSP